MSSSSRRRWRNITLLLLAAAGLFVAHAAFRAKLDRLDYLTGWALLGIILLLAAYNGRKKIPFLPLGSSEGWLQIHIYAGYFALFLFVVHARYRVPKGWFEICLALVFGIVMLSGIVGLVLSRQLPKRLTTRGGEVLFECSNIVF